ncbi:MAG: cyclic nucleotide-binding domain-containing protein [Eubacteriales bacterium]|nr:cyclic nucleotide-binding domain-containing protein [Eubacteriales bacterium]
MIRKTFSRQYIRVLEQYGLAEFPSEYLCLLSYDKKEYIYQEGCPVSYILIILEGRAKVVTFTEDGRTLMHSFSEKGSILGEVEMLTENYDAALHVQAVTPVLCIGIPLPDATKLLKNNLIFINHLSILLARKLNSTNYNASRIILYTLENRLCSYIEMTSSGGCFEEQLTQVAELLGTSYRHLLRTLEKLCQEKILAKSGHNYLVLNPEALHQRGRGFYSSQF